MGVSALVVIAQLSAGLSGGGGLELELFTAAAASPRPRECLRPSTGTSTGAAWDRARQPGIHHFCNALARGYSALDSDPEAALRAALEAKQALGGRSEPLVLEGRALVVLGRFDEAYERLSAARGMSTSSLNAPEALYAFGVSALRKGERGVALDAYRELAPRLGMFADPWARQRAYVEAAALAMGRGPGGLDEALGYLREARRLESRPGFSDYVLGALALALDRKGRVEEAQGVASAADGPWRLAHVDEAGKPRDTLREKLLPILPPGELDAMIALLAERRDAELSRRKWEAFLAAQPNGPFSEHARKKLSALGRGTR